MPVFYDSVDTTVDVGLDIGVGAYHDVMTSEERVLMFELLIKYDIKDILVNIDMTSISSSEILLKELAYNMKFVNSDNLKFFIDELNYGNNINLVLS